MGGHWLDVHIYQTSEIEEEVATLNRGDPSRLA
jgi:hypothetical protein